MRPFLLLFLICTVQSQSEPPKIKVSPWPQADLLFKQDPRFRGGDGAYSIDLGGDRVLWLMGDSFIAKSSDLNRKSSTMIRNCVGIQLGSDPSKAKMRFTWRRSNSAPASFFPEDGSEWFWPGHGTTFEGKLLIFLMRLRHSETVLGFQTAGWEAVLIDNPKDKPRFWNLQWLDCPKNGWEILVGSAGVFVHQSYLYALSVKESKRHEAFLVRWPAKDAFNSNLSNPQWWDSSKESWTSQGKLSREPKALFPDAQIEFTMHYSKFFQGFLQIQTSGFGGASLASRLSKNLTGPWPGSMRFYTPEEAWTPSIMIYAGKAHPELSGAGLVLTYATNSLDFAQLMTDESLYYPRFLKMNWE